MALANPTILSEIQNASVGSSTTFALTMVVGTTYVVRRNSATSNKGVSSVSDNLGGNTWTVDKSQVGTACSGAIFSCKAATAGSATVTVNYSTSTTSTESFSIGTSTELTGTVDKAVAGTSTSPGTTTQANSGSSGTLTSGDQIAFAVSSMSGSPGTWTTFAGWTADAASTGARRYQWQVVAVTTALTAGGDYTTARNNTCVLCTYAGTPAATTKAPAPGMRPSRGQRMLLNRMEALAGPVGPRWKRAWGSGLYVPSYA